MWTRRSAATLALLAAGSALLAGCGAAVGGRADRRETRAEAAFPPTGPLIDVDGRRVHAHVEGRDRGRGRDIVLIHGASGNTRDFTFGLVGRLARDHRVIAFDRPGLGWSDDMGAAGISPVAQARALRRAAAELGVRAPVILGHSYGAAVALAWALEATGVAQVQDGGAQDGPVPAGGRDAVRGLVLVSGATMPWPGGLGPLYAIASSRLGGATLVPAIAAYAGRERADSAVARIFAPDPVPAGYVDHIGVGLSLRRSSLQANARQVNGLKPWLVGMARLYPRLGVPVELVHGTADTIVPIDIHSEPLAARLPDARLTRIEGAGHMPHHSHPRVVTDAIRRLTGA